MTDKLAGEIAAQQELTSVQRREMSRRNREQSAAAARLRQEQMRQEQPQAVQPQKVTAAVSAIEEQQRIIEERTIRSRMTAMNRSQAEARRKRHSIVMTESTDAPEEQPAEEPVPEEPEDNGIDIDVPTGDEKKPEPEETKPTEHDPPETPPKKKAKKSGKSGKSSRAKVQQSGRYRRTRTQADERGRITTGGAVTIGLLTVLLIGCVIYGRVQTNEVYTEIAKLQSEYDSIVSKNTSMRSEMESKMTVKNIERYAEDVLGLRQLHQSQIEYIQLQTEDEVTISEPEDNLFVTVNDYLKEFWEFLRGA